MDVCVSEWGLDKREDAENKVAHHGEASHMWACDILRGFTPGWRTHIATFLISRR